VTIFNQIKNDVILIL